MSMAKWTAQLAMMYGRDAKSNKTLGTVDIVSYSEYFSKAISQGDALMAM